MLVTTVVVVEIFTTDGINFSARSANEAGTDLEFTFSEKVNDKTIIKNIILICFTAITISYGVVHGAFVAIATSSKLAIQNNLDLNESVLLASEANNALRLLVYPIFGLLSVLFIYQVWKKNTLYPRWIILFFPLIPFLIQDFICKNLSGNIWIIVCGGYLNHILIIFFTASTIALWNKKN